MGGSTVLWFTLVNFGLLIPEAAARKAEASDRVLGKMLLVPRPFLGLSRSNNRSRAVHRRPSLSGRYSMITGPIRFGFGAINSGEDRLYFAAVW